MKKIFSLILFCAAAVFVSCEKDKTDPDIAVTDVKISDVTVTLAPNENKTLTVTVTPDDATNTNVLWSSDNKSAATVSDKGVVTAVAVGKATITVMSEADHAKRATCVVTVDKIVIPVTEVTLDPKTLSLEQEQTKTLTAAVTPDNATNMNVVWTSDNEKIAKVSETGVVTGVGTGQTKIWAMSEADNSVKASCDVTVTAKLIGVTVVALDKKTLSVEVEKSAGLKVTVKPDDATNMGVVWSSDDQSIAKVSQTGNVTGVAAGKTIITVTSSSDNTKFDTCEVTVTPKEIPATDMWVKTENLELQIGQTGAISAVTIPTDATNQNIVWTSDDETIATVNDKGVVKAVKAGTTYVYARWGGNPAGVHDKCTVVVLPSNGYAIGDLYPNATDPIGVVFWKDPQDEHSAKIISLMATNIAWATTTYKTKAYDKNDGEVNMATVKAISSASWASLFPVFNWCVQMGEGWYLPAETEAMEIYKSREAINTGMAKTTDGVELPSSGQIWTSTEHSTAKENALTVLFSPSGTGAAGTSFYAQKSGESPARAIKKISL